MIEKMDKEQYEDLREIAEDLIKSYAEEGIDGVIRDLAILEESWLGGGEY